eukprot:scaffold74475_cov32-Tisochrysis_lutea.AAC.4
MDEFVCDRGLVCAVGVVPIDEDRVCLGGLRRQSRLKGTCIDAQTGLGARSALSDLRIRRQSSPRVVCITTSPWTSLWTATLRNSAGRAAVDSVPGDSAFETSCDKSPTAAELCTCASSLRAIPPLAIAGRAAASAVRARTAAPWMSPAGALDTLVAATPNAECMAQS